MEVLEKIKKIILNDNNEPNLISKVIEKIFSKQLRNQKFVKYYSLFFYIYVFGIELIFSLILLFYIESDDKFSAGTYKIALTKHLGELIAYTLSLSIFGSIYGQSQIYYQYPLRCFISRNTWHNFVRISLNYYPVIFFYPIKIFVSDVYRISKQYGNTVPPESIQIIQSIYFSIVLGLLLMNVSSKAEEFLMELYDHGSYIIQKRNNHTE